jgi:hypothetical protein
MVAPQGKRKLEQFLAVLIGERLGLAGVQRRRIIAAGLLGRPEPAAPAHPGAVHQRVARPPHPVLAHQRPARWAAQPAHLANNDRHRAQGDSREGRVATPATDRPMDAARPEPRKQAEEARTPKGAGQALQDRTCEA